MKQWYQHTALSLGLAATLAGMAGCTDPYEKLDRFVVGKVLEETIYGWDVEPTKVSQKIGEKTERTMDYSGADTGKAYVLKIAAQEMAWDETTGTQKMVPQTYTLTVRDSSSSVPLPISLLDKQISVGTELVFRTRDDQGNLLYPVSRSGIIDAQQFRIIRPYDDLTSIKGGLEGEVRIEAQLQEKQEEKRLYTEARKFFNEKTKKKE